MPVASGEAQLGLRESGGELRMDFDFKGGGGFVVARKEVRSVMPEAFAIRVKLSGRGPLNHLELKLVDDTGKNVWRYVLKNFALPRRSREWVVKSQDIEFAWGPAGGGAPSKLGAVELAVVAGPGGSGVVRMGDWRLEDLSFAKRPVIEVSSAARGHGKQHVLDDSTDTCWRPAAQDLKPWIELDSLEPRLLGGLVVQWEQSAPAKGFIVRGSNDGKRWRRLYTATRAGGVQSFIYLPHTTTRYLRLELHEPAGIASLKVQPFEFSRSIESFFHAVAAMQPRGWLPTWLVRQQSLWTPAGGLMRRTCALLNEQGLWESDEGSFTIEPMVSVHGKLFTWADVKITQGLVDGWMPLPWVLWEGRGWRLKIQLQNEGDEVSYRFENTSGKRMKVRLHALLRPFQVTPPWQHFRNVGGVSPIHDLAWEDGAVKVNGTHVARPVTPGASFRAMSFDEGSVIEALAADGLPERTKVKDTFGFATGVLTFDAVVAAGEAHEVIIEVSQVDAPRSSVVNDQALWLSSLPHDELSGAGWATDAIKASLTATAHVLLTQAGPALQPGPRRYTRSWIRDGATMSAALLRAGRSEEVKAFIEWYVPFQRKDGFVPCCVDRDGVDWLVEHDSHGQLIALIKDYHDFTQDETFLRQLWPAVKRTVLFIQRLREKDGLLPISVSHEGYLAQPVHSYWDDFWMLRGLRDAVTVARVLGKEAEAKRWTLLEEKMTKAVFAAVEATRVAKGLAYSPASREWADFDPTATANAITMLDMPEQLDATALEWTFNKYMEDWRKKRTGELPWTNYTAYEIRIIGAMVRMRKRADALELLKFFLSDRRPLAWNQWPEISWADPKSPGHVGDVPHTWIAAEYALTVRSLFAYESESRNALILGAGLAPECLDGDGVAVKAMLTRHGRLSYRIWREGETRLRFEVDAGLELPSGGLVLRPPGKLLRAVANGKRAMVRKDEVVIHQLPAQGIIHTTPL